MPRGRLINRFSAQFAMLDAATTVYDSDYTDIAYGNTRQETLINIPCQVEEGSWFRSTYKPQGLEQDGEITIILHYENLELLGLIDINGAPLINIGTRLVSISTEAGIAVRQFPLPSGMYVIQARDSSFGLSIDNNPTRNLYILLLSPRPQAI